jgi:hypothetical protein
MQMGDRNGECGIRRRSESGRQGAEIRDQKSEIRDQRTGQDLLLAVVWELQAVPYSLFPNP